MTLVHFTFGLIISHYFNSIKKVPIILSISLYFSEFQPDMTDQEIMNIFNTQQLTAINCFEEHEACFDLSKRGAIGETILHLCFLNDSSMHREIASHLLAVFPKLSLDMYEGSDFFGRHIYTIIKLQCACCSCSLGTWLTRSHLSWHTTDGNHLFILIVQWAIKLLQRESIIHQLSLFAVKAHDECVRRWHWPKSEHQRNTIFANLSGIWLSHGSLIRGLCGCYGVYVAVMRSMSRSFHKNRLAWLLWGRFMWRCDHGILKTLCVSYTPPAFFTISLLQLNQLFIWSIVFYSLCEYVGRIKLLRFIVKVTFLLYKTVLFARVLFSWVRPHSQKFLPTLSIYCYSIVMS